MSFTNFYSNKIPSFVPLSDTENFHEKDLYEQCLDVLMYVGIGAMLLAFVNCLYLINLLI